MSTDIFKGKKIVLGVTGCIAAYKSAFVLRELIHRGADVKTVMTPSATEFITPLTFSSLSKNNVVVNTFPSSKDSTDLATWHIDLAMWADLILIAPATVNTVAKIAHGFADNALTTVVSAARSPVIIAPAADVDMYENPLNKENLQKLESLGYFIVYAEEGELASGLKGTGRLAGINKIVDSAEIVLSKFDKNLDGKKLLVTAGPTYEDIDPVRFIGNRSSGKMGFEIAKAAFLRGANVTLVSGPSYQEAYPEIKRIDVRSALEMKKAIIKELKNNDILIMSAAVADFKPSKINSQKIKKSKNFSEIKITRTDDILSSIRKENKTVVGFALETDNELANAKRKLDEKKLDMIVLNSLKDKKSGFEFNTNRVTIIKKKGKAVKLPLQSKFRIANKILNEVVKI